MLEGVKATRALPHPPSTALWGLAGGVFLGLGVALTYSHSLFIFLSVLAGSSLIGMLFGYTMGQLVEVEYEIEPAQPERRAYHHPSELSAELTDHLQLRRQERRETYSESDRITLLQARPRNAPTPMLDFQPPPVASLRASRAAGH